MTAGSMHGSKPPPGRDCALSGSSSCDQPVTCAAPRIEESCATTTCIDLPASAATSLSLQKPMYVLMPMSWNAPALAGLCQKTAIGKKLGSVGRPCDQRE